MTVRGNSLSISRKKLLTVGAATVVVMNALIVGTLYFAGVIFQPSQEELEAQRLAEEEAKKEAEMAAKYAHLEPLPEFKSKAKYVSSMGEAVDICERKLNDTEPGRKSWAVNYIESRHLPHKELYLIFIDYETIGSVNKEPKMMKATCDVDEAKKEVAAWKATPVEH